MKKTKTKKISQARSRRSHAHPSTKNPPEHFVKVYWPYIPLIALVVVGLIYGVGFRPNQTSARHGVLAYATEMSQSGLLSNTNAERTSRGLSALSLNAKLNQAAQAKANDMVARNYWSHNTPDGQAPWVFVADAGYAYNKAGENLAYGFASSSATVVGWMNSAGHRANILDSAFKEVGFGFANSPNFVGTGEETVVVAMYADPQVLAVSTPPPAPAATKPATKPAETAQTSQTAEAEAEEKAEEVPVTEEQFTNETPAGTETDPTRITKLQTLTGGKAPWSAIALSGLSILIVGLWLAKHAVVVKRALITGEKFVLHHPALDITVAVFIAVAVVLSTSSGVIK